MRRFSGVSTAPASPLARIVPSLKQQHIVGHAAGMEQVVQHDGDAPALPRDIAQPVEDVELVARIEAGQRLVGEQPVGFAGEHAGEQHAGALAARQFVDRASGEMTGLGRGHGLGDSLGVTRVGAGKGRAVRGAAERDHVGRGDVPVHPRILGQIADAARPLAGASAATSRSSRRTAPALGRDQRGGAS